MYVRASDFRRTEAISRRKKRTKPLVQELQNNGARVDRYARIANIILTGLRYLFAFFFFFFSKKVGGAKRGSSRRCAPGAALFRKP